MRAGALQKNVPRMRCAAPPAIHICGSIIAPTNETPMGIAPPSHMKRRLS